MSSSVMHPQTFESPQRLAHPERLPMLASRLRLHTLRTHRLPSSVRPQPQALMPPALAPIPLETRHRIATLHASRAQVPAASRLVNNPLIHPLRRQTLPPITNSRPHGQAQNLFHDGHVQKSNSGTARRHVAGSYPINASKRQELRTALMEGRANYRKSKSPSPSILDQADLTTEQREFFEAECDRWTRWNIFLIHSVANHRDLLRFVWGDRIAADSSQWNTSYKRILDSNRSFKSKTLAKIRNLVARQIEADATLLLATDQAYTDKINREFSAQTYFSCFAFIKDHLDFEGSTDLGKWFVKSKFVSASNCFCATTDSFQPRSATSATAFANTFAMERPLTIGKR